MRRRWRARATRLKRLRREALVLQFGGAAGTLAALGDRGLDVAVELADELDLPLPDGPWHTHRDRLGEVASAFAILAGTCGKIARDVVLMMQTEVGEAYEPAARRPRRLLHHAAQAQSGRVRRRPRRRPRSPRSSAPRSLRPAVQEHERAAGAWAAEWPTFPALALVTSGALAAVVDIAEGLDVDAERMRANLDLTGGQIMTEAIAFKLAENDRQVRRPQARRGSEPQGA